MQIKLLCEMGSGVRKVYVLYYQNVRVDQIMFGYSSFGYCRSVEFRDGCLFSATMLDWRAAVLILSFSWLGVFLYCCVRCRDYTSFSAVLM